jgi:hypothetical protein
MVSRTVSLSGSAFVCEVGQIPNTLGPAGLGHQLLVVGTPSPFLAYVDCDLAPEVLRGFRDISRTRVRKLQSAVDPP